MFWVCYVAPGASERHYVNAIRLAMLAFTVIATLIALSSDHVLGLLQFLTKIIYASGFAMLLLRWFWWRMNGWADVAAQALALPVTLFYEQAGKFLGPDHDPVALLSHALTHGTADDHYAVSFTLTVGTTTLLWVCVMLFTKPEPMDKPEGFYRRVRPDGWWSPFARRCPDVMVTDRVRDDLKLYALGLLLSLGLLFGLGLILFARWGAGTMLLVTGGFAGGLLVRAINRRYSPPNHSFSSGAELGGIRTHCREFL